MAAPLAGHTNSYHTYGLDEALAGIAAAGFRGVELSAVPGWTQHLDLSGTEEIRRTLARHGLTAVSLSAHSDLTTREGLQHGVKAVRWAADAAEAARVIVALEIHGDIMATGEKTLALLRKIGRPNVIKVNYDTGNVEYYGGVRAVDDLPKIAPYVAHVHLKDTMGGRGVWDFPALGSGTVDFARVLEILRRADYTGPYSVELEFQGEPWPSLAEVTAAMRRSYAHLRSLGLP